jgi:ABC-2 type transport system permease protein
MSGVDTNPTGSVWLVARRELRILRTRKFAFSAVVIALALAGYLALEAQLADSGEPHVGLYGQASSLSRQLANDAAALGEPVTVTDVGSIAAGQAQVEDGTLDAFVSGTPSAMRVTVKESLNGSLRAAITGLAQDQALDGQLAEAGLNPAQVHERLLAAGVQVESIRPADPDRGGRFALGLGFAVVLYLSLVVYGSRLLSSLGTALGVGLLAVVQVSGLAVLGVLLAALFGLLGLSWAVLWTLLAGVIWFALGYLLYAGTLRQLPRHAFGLGLGGAGVLFVVGATVLFQAPDSATGDALSLLPPFAPILLPARIGLGDTSGWQFALSLLLSVAAAAWLARRELYR